MGQQLREGSQYAVNAGAADGKELTGYERFAAFRHDTDADYNLA
jgi:hypothetical protein